MEKSDLKLLEALREKQRIEHRLAMLAFERALWHGCSYEEARESVFNKYYHGEEYEESEV